jgi:Fe-S-cluster-containing hydrogenase component 2
MALRNIIHIDEEKCNGCGQCVVDCAEAALQIVNGKARLVKEIYCDGLGACIGSCPTGALTIVQREADPFDEEATEEHIKKIRGEKTEKKQEFCACPGSLVRNISDEGFIYSEKGDTRPELTNWPIQLMLVPVNAPYFKDAEILLSADCTAFSTINFHSRFIKGKKLIIACPKLDNAKFYLEKLTDIFTENSIKSVTVVRMEVPCCGGLMYIVNEAIKASGKILPIKEIVIGINGEF